jgi:hypothetical protein
MRFINLKIAGLIAALVASSFVAITAMIASPIGAEVLITNSFLFYGSIWLGWFASSWVSIILYNLLSTYQRPSSP